MEETSEALQAILEPVDVALGELRDRRPLSPGAIARMRDDLSVLHSYDSNAIEGSTLTLQETVLVVKEGITIGSKPIRDAMAARGYAAGFKAIFDFVDRRVPLSVDLIKDFHRYVMLGALPEFCGMFRDHNVYIANAKNTRLADFREIYPKVEELVNWFNEDARLLHPIHRAALFHVRFETIHPFLDGNGRTGRLLLNYQLVRNGLWPVNIRYGADRLNYYEAFDTWRATGNIAPMTSIIAAREIEQLKYCCQVADDQAEAEKLQKAGLLKR